MENWTKWQLYLGEGENRVTLYPHMQLSIANMVRQYLTIGCLEVCHTLVKTID